MTTTPSMGFRKNDNSNRGMNRNASYNQIVRLDKKINKRKQREKREI